LVHQILRQFATFAFVGAFGTSAHYLVLALLVEVWTMPVPLATTAGFVCGAVVNYVLNRRFTFDSASSHAVALPKFLTVAVLGAAINWLVVSALLGATSLHYFVAQFLATGTVLVFNFVANYLWTFRA
jgi:putative flippase GtrA